MCFVLLASRILVLSCQKWTVDEGGIIVWLALSDTNPMLKPQPVSLCQVFDMLIRVVPDLTILNPAGAGPGRI